MSELPPATGQARSPAASPSCDYCHLPVVGRSANDGPVYCCLGCRLAAEITGQSGRQGAVQWTLVRLGLAIFLSLNVMMFTMALWTQELQGAASEGPLADTLADLFRYLCLVLSLPVLFLLGGPMLTGALARRRTSGAADLLIVLGVAAAYLYSAVSVLRGSGHIYFEVGCAVLVMVTLGRWLEAHGKLKTTEALEALEKLLPAEVLVVGDDGRDTYVPLAEVRVGQRLHVRPGERIATDGRILTGQASLDQQMLTGESRPASKAPGDEVLGGSLNLDGDLVIAVTELPADSSLARIVDLVRHARQRKGRYERIADRVAAFFLPAVIAIALVAFVWHATASGLDQGVLAGLAVLLIACPCALGLATPMAVWAALGSASRAGVLFSDGESLERLAAIRAVRFDKTGTLTTGTPRIRRFVVAEPRLREEVLRRAACLARASTHAYSRAIGELAANGIGGAASSGPWLEQGATLPVVCTSPGEGVVAQFRPNETPTRLGSLPWLERSRHGMTRCVAQAATDALLVGESLSAIGWNRQVQGLFVFSETLRPGVREALAACVARGCDVAVLTGDHAARGRALAKSLQVPVHAELLPHAKVAALERARAEIGPVAMVGDGVNDAPALAASDLGIAMGCGVDVSRDSAGVCLLSDELSLVPWTLDLARRTVRVIRQNLFWAFAYNTLGIGLAAAGWLNPMWAAGAMVVSSVLVVGNSLRLAHVPPPSAAGMEPRPDAADTDTRSAMDVPDGQPDAPPVRVETLAT